MQECSVVRMPAEVMIGRERGIQAAKFFRVCLQRLQLPGGSKLGDEEVEEEEEGWPAI